MPVSVIMRRSIMECQSEVCTQRVRLFVHFVGTVEEFRCARCLPHTTFSTDQVEGNYVLCSNCQAQYKVTAIKPTPLCFDCQEHFHNPNSARDPELEIPDPSRNRFDDDRSLEWPDTPPDSEDEDDRRRRVGLAPLN